MPKREDERWRADKEHLRYCSKHERYYYAKCQLCEQEELSLRKIFVEKQRRGELQELEQCPVCKRKSLFWNNDTKHYECLNSACMEPDELTPI